MNERLSLRLTGENLSPEKVRAGKLAEILQAVEDLIAAVVAQEHAQLTRESLVISLLSIEAGSIGLHFDSQLPEVVVPAFTRVAASIQNHQLEALPSASFPPFDTLLRFLRQYKAQADFAVLNGREETLATLTHDFTLPRPSYVTGETTLYGEIVRVGGVEPKVEIKTTIGKTLYCPFEKSLAPQLGARLYKVSGLRGQAKWNLATREIEEFLVTDITHYEDTPITEAFDQLSELAGKYYEDITDVNAYLAKLRGRE